MRDFHMQEVFIFYNNIFLYCSYLKSIAEERTKIEITQDKYCMLIVLLIFVPNCGNKEHVIGYGMVGAVFGYYFFFANWHWHQLYK